MRAIELTPTRWSRVRVDDVRERRAPGVDPGTLVTVRVCVHLGELLPADVRVELVARGTAGGARADSHALTHRLSSVQSYQNGTFVYEASVPPLELRGREGYAIRVTPSSGYADVADLPPIVRWVPPRGAITGRARSTFARPDADTRMEHR